MLIEFENAFVQAADGRRIIQGVDAMLSEPRIGVVGPNGAGKSSLARLINGLLLPTQGAVRVDGLDTRTEVRAVRRKVGFVFQNPDNQIVYPVVRDDLAFGLPSGQGTRAQRDARVLEALTRLGVAHLIDAPSHLLSGGEKQLVALAAVLVTEPALIVFDEPSTQLDLRNRNRVAQAIEALACPCVVVTHDLDLLQDFDRVLVVNDGLIAVDDAPAAAIAWYRKHCA